MLLVFDIGGTHIRSATSKDGKTFDKPSVILDTPKDWEEAKKVLHDVCQKQGKAEQVCVAIAGEFDENRSQLVFSPNLLDWVEKPLKRFFEDETGASVRLVNDAVAAAIGEARQGAGKGHVIVAYLTVGTGLGGARVVNGELDENSQGFEPGQQIIDSTSGDTLEKRVAGAGFAAQFGVDFVKTAPKEAWEAAAKELAVGIHNTIDYWSPDIIVFGGSMILKPNGIPLDRVRAHLTALNKKEKIPPIVPAALGDESGLRGALAILTQG